MKRRTFLKAAVSSFALPTAALVSLKQRVDLSPWCSKLEGPCYDLRQPFSQQGFTFATDSRAIIRVSGESIFDHDSPVHRPPVSQVFWDVFEARGVQWHAPKFERVDGMSDRDEFWCPDCFRQPSRAYPWRESALADCQTCGGSSIANWSWRVADQNIQPFYGNALQQLGAIEVANLEPVSTPLIEDYRRRVLRRSVGRHAGGDELKCIAFRNDLVRGFVMGTMWS